MENDNILNQYSGPFSLKTEHLSRIGELAAVNRCGQILKPFGLSIELVQEMYHETRCFLYPADSEPVLQPTTRLYTLPQLERLCDAVKDGTIDFNHM